VTGSGRADGVAPKGEPHPQAPRCGLILEGWPKMARKWQKKIHIFLATLAFQARRSFLQFMTTQTTPSRVTRFFVLPEIWGATQPCQRPLRTHTHTHTHTHVPIILWDCWALGTFFFCVCDTHVIFGAMERKSVWQPSVQTIYVSTAFLQPLPNCNGVFFYFLLFLPVLHKHFWLSGSCARTHNFLG